MVAVAAAVPPTPPPPAAAVVAAAATEAAAVAVAARDESPRGKSVLDEFLCNKFPPTRRSGSSCSSGTSAKFFSQTSN